MKKMINNLLVKTGYIISKYHTKDDLIFEAQKKLLDLNRRNIIFDVGGYDGKTSLKYNQYLKDNCEIYSFEPFQESFQILEENISAKENIKGFNIAIGNQDGEKEFYSNNFSATNSFLPPSPEGIKEWGAGLYETQKILKVPTLTIDSFVKENNIDQIDILKMDTQGTEHLVMEGAKETIAKGKIKIIFTELIVVPTYKNQLALDDILEVYRTLGFELYKLFPYSNPEGKLRYMDGIFTYKH